jgi:uncharacterized caspase-like protein
MKKFLSRAFVTIALLVFVNYSFAASEIFKADGSLSGVLSRYAPLGGKFTVAGYPLPIDGPKWILINSGASRTTGSASPLLIVNAVFTRTENGKIVEVFSVTATMGQSPSSGWDGDPCGVPSIEKINVVRGRLDRCAIAMIKETNLNGVPTKYLILNFIESNEDGRYLKYEYVIFYGNLGLTDDRVQAPDLRARLRSWMSKMLDATVTAASYAKPSNAFDGIPTLQEAVFESESERLRMLAQAEQARERARLEAERLRQEREAEQERERKRLAEAEAERARMAEQQRLESEAANERERQRVAALAAERARLAEEIARERRAREALLQVGSRPAVFPPGTEKRVALVMGNARYVDRPLRNPSNDSALMASTLKGLGFDVLVANDVDRRGMLSALRELESRARGADVAMFYFAGHGAQVGGANFLIPVGAGIRVENDVVDEAIDASSVLRRIEDSGVKVGLVVLDACRDNPYPGASRSTARGLARMSAPTGSIVAYATAPGSTAEDGTGDNGTYTIALARHLSTPGLDIKEVFDRTAQEVERVTNGKQRPREEVGLRGRFALLEVPAATGSATLESSGSGAATATDTSGLSRAGGDEDSDVERTAWEIVVRRDTAAGYEAFLRVYPNSRFAPVARVALETLKMSSSSSVAK